MMKVGNNFSQKLVFNKVQVDVRFSDVSSNLTCSDILYCTGCNCTFYQFQHTYGRIWNHALHQQLGLSCHICSSTLQNYWKRFSLVVWNKACFFTVFTFPSSFHPPFYSLSVFFKVIWRWFQKKKQGPLIFLQFLYFFVRACSFPWRIIWAPRWKLLWIRSNSQHIDCNNPRFFFLVRVSSFGRDEKVMLFKRKVAAPEKKKQRAAAPPA